MKTINLLLLFGLLGISLCVNPASGQTPVSLGAQLYPGLSITGKVGSVYAIQATTNVAQTDSWSCLAFVQLQTTNTLWLDPAGPTTRRRSYRAVQFDGPTNLVFIPPGTLRMGSPMNEVDRSTDEGPQTTVTLTKGFFIGKYLVRQGDYLAVVGSNPSFFNTNGGSNPDLAGPVEAVNWNDATNYCAKRTQQEAVAGRILAGSHYRLPTEAEWEYACRAWTSTRFYYGEDVGYTNLKNYAWYGFSSSTTQPVGLKLPNAWGLFDMAGNVWEWCQDWYGPYPGGTATDPQGPGTGTDHVIRGGSWDDGPQFCRSAARFVPPANRLTLVGFRVGLVSGQ